MQQLFALAFEHPVDRNAGPAATPPARCRSAVTTSATIGEPSAVAIGVLGRLDAAFRGRGSRHRQARRRVARSPWRCAISSWRARRVELFLELLAALQALLFGEPLAATAPAPAPRGRRVRLRAGRAASCEASSVSFFSASRSILSCMMRRSSSSSASGLLSTAMRSRAAASSIRSMALSGRKRSVM